MSELFSEKVKVDPCGETSCSNGHNWSPTLRIAKCPGCGQEVVAVRMINCPVCNEPQDTIKIRFDHVVDAAGVMPVCRGQKGLHNHTFVNMNLHHAEVAEENWDEEVGRVKVPEVIGG